MQRVPIDRDGEWGNESGGDDPEVVILTLLHTEYLQWGEGACVDMYPIVIDLVVTTYRREVYICM